MINPNFIIAYRNFSFKSVSLISAKGSIKVDSHLIELNNSLACSSGSLSKR